MPLDKSGFQAPSAKIRVGPISGQKSTYPLPQRYPHITPIGPAAFDGSVPDKLPFTTALQQGIASANNGISLLTRQWRFLNKVSFIGKPLDQSIPLSTTQNVSTRGINISLGLNQAIKLRRYTAFVYDKANSLSMQVRARGIEIHNLNDLPTSPSGDIPPLTPFIMANAQNLSESALNGVPLQGPDTLHVPAIIGGDGVFQINDWHEYDDYSDFFSSSLRGLVDITIQYQGRWQINNGDAGAAHTATSQEAILYELYELVTN